jgi:hypothetical protein
MQRKRTAVEFQEGKNDILVVAPHVVQNDDDNTENIPFNMATELECS